MDSEKIALQLRISVDLQNSYVVTDFFTIHGETLHILYIIRLVGMPKNRIWGEKYFQVPATKSWVFSRGVKCTHQYSPVTRHESEYAITCSSLSILYVCYGRLRRSVIIGESR